ncbi:MAG: hypothetical protein IT179_19285 [Acidobacteria bacterium]|nr:hypothetical protein [Acidobacteriota bacterium]
MRPDRRTLLTAAALVVVLGAVAWTFFGPSTPAPASVAQADGRRNTLAGAPLPSAEAVRLADLDAPRAKPSEATRDPFRFQARASQAGVSSPGAAPVFAPVQTAPAGPTEPAGPPPPPPITLKFIGVVETAGGLKLAVLSQGEGRAPMHGKEGDIIDGRYRILRIGTESIEMAHLDGRGRQTIRLTGQ